MDTERTVAATVRKLIRGLDDEAGLEALMQASESRRRGDLESEAFWLSVYAAMGGPAGSLDGLVPRDQ